MLRSSLFCHAQTASADEKGNAPNAAEGDDDIHDAAEQAHGAKQPGNKIEIKNANQTPVDAPDDAQDQCQNVHKNC